MRSFFSFGFGGLAVAVRRSERPAAGAARRAGDRLAHGASARLTRRRRRRACAPARARGARRRSRRLLGTAPRRSSALAACSAAGERLAARSRRRLGGCVAVGVVGFVVRVVVESMPSTDPAFVRWQSCGCGRCESIVRVSRRSSAPSWRQRSWSPTAPCAPGRGVSLALAPMPESGPSERVEPADLALGAVDVLPAGRARARGWPRARRCGSSSGSTRPPPTSTSATSSCSRSCASSRRPATRVVLIIGDYTARVGDPSGRSALRPVLTDERDRRQRADLPGAGLQGARPRADRGPLQQRVARHAERRAVRPRPALHGRPAARARRLHQAHGGRASRSRCSSCSTRCCRATTPSRSTSDIELGGTDQKFNLLFGRDVQASFGKRAAGRS